MVGMKQKSGEARVSTYMLRAVVTAVVALMCVIALGGCAQSTSSSSSSSSSSSAAQPAKASLDGVTLNIYCGAGMTEPFKKIADEFTNETGCAMNVTYANAAQIQTQINTTQQGDFFIAGSADELKPVETYVASSTDLVKHIPVLAVPKDNPSNINSLTDLAGAAPASVLIGDPESTPIGKIAKKAFTDAGIMEGLQSSGALTTTTTAPQIATALANGQGVAGIVWKENANVDGVTIVATDEMAKYVKTVPSARLTFVSNAEAADAFSEFLASQTAKDIWSSFGYEQV